MKKTMLLIDVLENEVREVQAETLDDYYNLTKCDCIDIVQRRIGKKRYDIICDDEGLLKAGTKISAINNMGEPMLVGNLLIAGLADNKGELTSLTEEDIEYIKKRVQTMSTRKYPQGYKMLTECGY